MLPLIILFCRSKILLQLRIKVEMDSSEVLTSLYNFDNFRILRAHLLQSLLKYFAGLCTTSIPTSLHAMARPAPKLSFLIDVTNKIVSVAIPSWSLGSSSEFYFKIALTKSTFCAWICSH